MDFSRYKLSLNDAKSKIETYDLMNDTEFSEQIRHWAMFDVPEDNYCEGYKHIREDVVETFKNALSDNENRIDYNIDLRVGIKLYELLSPMKNFNIIQANDNDIWRYISVCVMPDITFIRYPNHDEDVIIIRKYLPDLTYAGGKIDTEKDSLRIKKQRFFSHTRRIWLKTLWWYIHLGWQGNSEETYEVLKNNGTNIISHFIERPGRGYRLQLFRCMLYAYSLLPEQKDSTFRAAAKLNRAKCVSMEPALAEGGEIRYSKMLFDEVYHKEAVDQNVEKNNFK